MSTQRFIGGEPDSDISSSFSSQGSSMQSGRHKRASDERHQRQGDGDESPRKTGRNSPAARKLLTIIASSPNASFSSKQQAFAAATLEQEQPPTANMMAYLIFFLLGVGMLFPWNVFIMCKAYFLERLQASSFSHSFSNFFTTIFTSSNVLFLTYLNFAKGRPMPRMISSLCVNGTVFLLCAILTQITSIDPNAFFYTNALVVFACGGSTAFLQSGVFGLVATFPPIYTQAVMSGQGLAAVVVALAQMVSLFVGKSDESSSVSFSALVYFGFAAIVISLCIFATLYLRNLPLYRNYTRLAEESQVISTTAIEYDPTEPDFLHAKHCAPKISYYKVFRKISPLALSVFLVFFMTLSVFPATVTMIEPASAKNPDTATWHKLFLPLVFLLFSLGDWLGKSIPGFPSVFNIPFHKPSKPFWILLLTLLRFLFIPAFLMCNIYVDGKAPFWFSGIFNNDFEYFAILVLFSVTNGWLSSLAMIHAPSLVTRAPTSVAYVRVGESSAEEEEDSEFQITLEKQAAGSMMVYLLTLGLACGSAASFVIRAAMCGCNPFLE